MTSLYRSLMFVPGNNPSQLIKAEIYRPDALILDLEDAVSIYEKDAARILVRKALETLTPSCPMGVRINGMDTVWGEQDVRELVVAKPTFFRLPKTVCRADVQSLDQLITEEEKKHGLPVGEIKIMSSLESALGLLNAYEIATASPRMMAIGLGAEDFCADMKMERTKEGQEIAWGRSMVVTCAHAAGIMAFDCVFSDAEDEEGFRKDTAYGRTLGFDGRLVIHPNQIPLVHELYSPKPEEVVKAQKIIEAYEQAMTKGSGVVALNGKMIDAPVVKRAEYILQRAGIKAGEST